MTKECPATYTDGYLMSDLDHILATDNVAFQSLGHTGHDFAVKVTGWQQLQGPARQQFIDGVSDHCSLYCEVV